MRCSIIGPSGAGKSSLAKILGDTTGTPVVHLDKHFWGPGWEPSLADEWQKHVVKLVSEPNWIIEGSYRRTLPTRLAQSEIVIFLDYPAHVYMGRLIKRYSTAALGHKRNDVREGCHEELRQLPRHLLWMRGWKDRARPDVLEKLKELQPEQTLCWLRHPNDVEETMRLLISRSLGA